MWAPYFEKTNGGACAPSPQLDRCLARESLPPSLIKALTASSHPVLAPNLSFGSLRVYVRRLYRYGTNPTNMEVPASQCPWLFIQR